MRLNAIFISVLGKTSKKIGEHTGAYWQQLQQPPKGIFWLRHPGEPGVVRYRGRAAVILTRRRVGRAHRLYLQWSIVRQNNRQACAQQHQEGRDGKGVAGKVGQRDCPQVLQRGLKSAHAYCETSMEAVSRDIGLHLYLNKKLPCFRTVGWWRVQCPATFQLLIEKYIIPIAPTRGAVGASVGWRKTLYSHFKNTGDNYFNHKCKATSTQTEYVAKRRRIRIALQKKHFVSN